MFPRAMRAAFTAIFDDPTCIEWWLPNGEGLSPSLRSIRAFADDRNANPVSEQTESVREISALFDKIGLDRSGSEATP